MVAHDTTDSVNGTEPVSLVEQLKTRYVKCVTDACTICVMMSGMLPDDTSWAKKEKFKSALKILDKDIKGCYKANTALYDSEITAAAMKRAEEANATDTCELPGQEEAPDHLPSE